jgi:hypothetical protein
MRRSCAVCVASLAALAGGCGGEDKPSRPDAAVIADAAKRTSAAGTARVSTTVTGVYKGQRLGLGTRTGIVDGKRGRAVVDFDFAFLAPNHSEMARESLKGTLVYYGDVVFAATGALYARYASGKGWYEFTRDKVDRPGGPGSGLAGLGTVDQTRPVDLLRAARGQVRSLGGATVGGARVKGYSTVIDLTRYLDIAAAERPDVLRHAVATFEQSMGAYSVPVEAWIASDGTVRRMRTTVKGHGLRLTFTTDLAGIGKPQTVRRPPPRNVFDLRGRR